MPTEHTPLLRHCLEATAQRLSDEFRGVFSSETLFRYVGVAYEQVGDRPTVGPNFLPVIIERFAREQLWAIAQADGMIEKPLPEVLFVCEHNAGRSQMAARLTAHLSNGWIAVRSAGSHPEERIDPVVVEAMVEIGLDVSDEFPKPLTDAVIRAADVVVTLGCGDACPVYTGKRYQDWPVDDPAGMRLEVVRRIRYELYHHVWELIELLVPNVDLLYLQPPTGGKS
ncbi:MAG TPA: arsenate reductase ArsC [Solirubrobacteraceae bacterium]|nr:arsenate reductase ArsC [Solirubrobacteraceae bacterium]